MAINPDMTLRQARAEFYRENGFPEDGGISNDSWSPIGCRDLKVHLPNFEWRKKAIPLHDLHHILTGYPFRPTGEFQMSAWEFAAGPYPNKATTLFCLPLVSMGALIAPKRTFEAFIRGRSSRTLYSNHLDKQDFEKLLDRTVEDVRCEVLPNGTQRPSVKDYAAYLSLVLRSAALIAIPVIITASILMRIF